MTKKTSPTLSIVSFCNLKKDDQILIVLGTSISDRTGHQMIVQVTTSPNVCFCTTCKNQNKQNMHWNEQKTLINFISADLWPTKAMTSVHSLTIFAVSYSSESIRCHSGSNSRSDWSRTLLTPLLSMNGESICMPVFTQMADPDISNIFCKQLDNWTIG